jgi:hypothetical protein
MALSDAVQCTAKSKGSGERCKNPAVTGFTVCRIHGAGSKGKPGGRPIVHGRYSKHLPERLAGRYTEALSDQKLLELRDEIALIGTRLAELLERVDGGESAQRWKVLQTAYSNLRAATRSGDKMEFLAAMADLEKAVMAGLADYGIWREIAELTEQRRKLVESERKRHVEMQQMITSTQAMAMLAAVTDTIRRHVSDQAALSAIASDLRRLTVIEHE